MKKNSMILTGIALIVIGTIVSYFANFKLADTSAFAVVMFGAGISCAGIWTKREKGSRTWAQVISLALLGIGAFVLGCAGFAENTMTTIISSVFGVIAIIASLVLPIIRQKD